jgi:hypothetical protein
VCHQAKPQPNKALEMAVPIGCDLASICSSKTDGLHSKLALPSSTFEAQKGLKMPLKSPHGKRLFNTTEKTSKYKTRAKDIP